MKTLAEVLILFGSFVIKMPGDDNHENKITRSAVSG